LPNFNLPLVVEIPNGVSSPIVLKFKRVDEHGNAIDGKIENISFYGSFHCKEPNINDNDYNVKNPTRLLIKEPSNSRSKHFT